jgi:oligopeptide transport system substrate-binding protein
MKWLIILITFIGCTNKKNNDQKILRIPLTERISTIDPVNSYDTISATVVYQMYEQLYQYHYLKRPYTLEPLLAEDMPSVSNDGKTYTIKIKKNIYYHPNHLIGENRTVKASDFITQIKRLAFIPMRSNGWWMFEGKIKGIDDFRKKVGNNQEKLLEYDIDGLKAIDDHTLQIELNEPYPQLIYTLAMSFTSPIPIEIARNEDWPLENEVGTGPYYLEQWNKGLDLKMRRFTKYRHETYPQSGDRKSYQWKLLEDAGKTIPQIEQIHFKIMNEPQTRWLNFLSNNLDLLIIGKDQYKSAITPRGELDAELKKKNIQLQISPTLTQWWLSFNMNDPLLGKNLLLRKAIAHAINIDEYIELFTNNIGLKANSIFGPGIPGYSSLTKLPYQYDPELAKALLKQAGFAGGNGLPAITFDVRGNSTTSRQIAEFIHKELEKIGIKINISTNSFPGFLKKQKTNQLQFWLDGWALDYPDAENLLQLLHSRNISPGPNATSYANAQIDEWINQIEKITDLEKKVTLMQKIETQHAQDLPWIMLYYSRNYVLIAPRLKNYRNSDLIYNYIKYLRLND